MPAMSNKYYKGLDKEHPRHWDFAVWPYLCHPCHMHHDTMLGEDVRTVDDLGHEL